MFKTMIIFTVITVIVIIIFKNFSSDILNIVSKSPGSCTNKDVVFSNDLNLTADFYYSAKSTVCNTKKTTEPTEISVPTIVFVHGGSWRTGNKDTYKFVADFFTAKGYNVIIPNYRLFPTAAYPEFVEDLETFFLWLKKENEVHNINVDEIHLIGHSAGAFNVASYLFNEHYTKPIIFETYVGLSGPYDFFLPATHDKDYQPVFSKNNPQYNDKSSLPAQQLPNTNVAKTLKRALILHGEKDITVTPKNAANINALLIKSSIKSEYKIYKGKSHVQLVTGLANIRFLGFEMRDDILSFLAK